MTSTSTALSLVRVPQIANHNHLSLMNNKDFVNALSAKMGINAKDGQRLTDAFVSELAAGLTEGTPLTVQGFGSFEVKKKLERIVINPTTKQRMLVPPKLVLAFKPSTVLKEKLK